MDASDVGIGAVLSQKQTDGSERIIAYASRVFSKPERRYCVMRKEPHISDHTCLVTHLF